MSRSDYSDDMDDMWAHIRWRGRVASAIRGKRGQAFLREMLAALDAMPEKRLIDGDLEAAGEVCAIGAVGRCRGVNMAEIDPEDYTEVAKVFDIAAPLAREIVFENDEAGYYQETPENRWARIRAWVAKQVAPPERSRWISNEIGERAYQKALARWVKAGGVLPSAGG